MRRVLRARQATLEEWDSAWAECPWASYFQSTAWARVWERWRRERYRARALSLQLDDGVSVVLPMVIERRIGGLLNVARLSVGDTYGGWLCGRELSRTHADAIISWARDALGNMTWVMSPYDPINQGGGHAGGRSHTTLAIDLAEGFDALRARWSKGHRSATSQAERMGVHVRAARDDADWEAYESCYTASIARWAGSSGAPPVGLIRSLAHEPADTVTLLVAEAGGSVVAGAVLMNDRRVTTYWHAASLPDGLRLRAPTLIVQEAIRTAASSGRAIFDMGGSGGHEGVERFKLGFRPSLKPYSVLITESVALRAARWARDARQAVVSR